MTVDFSENFWGEGQKTNGIDVLFHNAKLGITTAKEISEFLKERSSLEEKHSKAIAGLVRVASNGCHNGSFGPIWNILKSLCEQISQAQTLMVQKIEDLVKEICKYTDELQKQYKAIKEVETPTVDATHLFLNAKSNVEKCKALYVQRCTEVEKCQKETAAAKDLEKAEVKMKKAHEEYKSWTEKYNTSTDDYVSKMTDSCKRFQDREKLYLEKMKEFMDAYATVMESNHEIIGKVQSNFREDCNKLSVEELLNQFVKDKATGSCKPCRLEVEEPSATVEISGSSEDRSSSAANQAVEKEKDKSVVVSTTSEKIFEGNSSADNCSTSSIGTSKGSRRTTSLLNLFIPQSQGNKSLSQFNISKSIDSPDKDINSIDSAITTLSRSNNVRGSKWFLRSRRGKKKEKKSKDKKDEVPCSNENGNSDPLSGATQVDNSENLKDPNNSGETTESPKIDAEGFSIRPKDVWVEDKGNFYSDSDTDSDEEPERRLHVEIKPITNGTTPLSASVDELRTTVENLTLSSGIMNRKIIIDADNHLMKRSQSVSQKIGNPSPPPRHPYAPLSPPVSMQSKYPTSTTSSPHNSSSTTRYTELGELFTEGVDVQPTLPPKTGNSRYTPSSNSSVIPRPPSRPRPEISRNTNSPSPAVSRTDSIASLETRSLGAGSHVGSRGPSPLTIGLNDTIPIAVAFHEIVHAFFKGNDESMCQVKMTGDMMLSFPAGIIQVFANNPSPAPLNFSVKTKQTLESLVCNKNLVDVEETDAVLNFKFNMSALTVLLKSHSEQNPNASYFNVDILKYQIRPKPGVASCPLHLVAFWKCENTQTDLRIDYKYNSRAMEPHQSEVISNNQKSAVTPAQLLQVCIAAPVDGGVKSMQSKPSAQWFEHTNRACWKLNSLSSKSENQGVGSLRARFEVSNGPSSNGTIAAQFSCENSTLSGCEFELSGTGYRVSLVKKRFVSGKYICDAEETSNRYAVPPECSKPITNL